MGGQGSHNKPTGCGASGAYALGPDDEEEEGGCLICGYIWHPIHKYNNYYITHTKLI